MPREWTEQELQFLQSELKKGEPIFKISEKFNEEFSNRTYDSIQKKIRRIREGGIPYIPKKEVKLEITPEQKSTLTGYIAVLKTLNRRPSIAELEEEGITRLDIKHRWGTLKKLELAARKEHEYLFNEVQVSSLLTPERKTSLSGVLGKTKRFIVTTAITGCRVDPDLLASMKNYCRLNNAELLIMVASDPAHQYVNDDSLGRIDNILEQDHLIVEDTEINNNLFLSAIKIEAKQIDPVAGLMELAQKNNSSYVCAHPQQRLKFVPVPAGNHPPAIMSTGAITQPDYTTDMYRSRRLAYRAHESHVMGGLIIEVEDEEIFHFRHFQANTDGSFVDWGKLYTANSIEDTVLEALVCGDEHAGRQNLEVIDARLRLCEELHPKRIVLHDLFDGRSISHHVDGKAITMAMRSQDSQDSLLDELVCVGQALERYEDLCDRIVIVKSNHDEHLVRYLEDGRFLKDPKNFRLALDLAAAIFDGKDPIKVGAEIANDREYEDITWLQRDQEYVVAGVDLSHHGDKGPNGSRGSIKQFATSVRASITGHSHTAEIYGSAWRVGTSTGRLDYCVGPSSWTNTDCLLYENGSRQMINYIQGRFKTE